MTGKRTPAYRQAHMPYRILNKSEENVLGKLDGIEFDIKQITLFNRSASKMSK
jgi:hypothetical protein